MSPTVNNTNLTAESQDTADPADVNWHVLFGACVALAAVISAGSLFSLVSLLKTRSRSAMCLIVASLSVDDLICVVPLCLAMVLQWTRNSETLEARDGSMCTLSGLLYVFQGLSSNIKGCLVVAYALYATKRIGAHDESNGEEGTGRCGRVVCALALVWVLSLVVSALPLCGWGRFVRASLGCLPHSDDLYAPFLFALYALCAGGLAVCAAPLAHRLLCSAEVLQPSAFTSLSRESLDRSFSGFGSHVTGLRNKSETCSCSSPASELRFERDGTRRCPARLFAQKRFSLILALARVLLWMPMMVRKIHHHTQPVHLNHLNILSTPLVTHISNTLTRVRINIVDIVWGLKYV